MSAAMSWKAFQEKYKIRKNLNVYDVKRIYSADSSYFLDLIGYTIRAKGRLHYWKLENEFNADLLTILVQTYKKDNHMSDSEFDEFISPNIANKKTTWESKEGNKDKRISQGDKRGFARIGVIDPTVRNSYSGLDIEKYLGRMKNEYSPLAVWNKYKFNTGLKVDYSLEDYLDENSETFSDGWIENATCNWIWTSGEKKGIRCNEKCQDFRLIPKLIPHQREYFTFLSQRTISVSNRCQEHLRPWIIKKENTIVIDIETENFTCGWLAPENGKSKSEHKLKFRVAVIYCYNTDKYYTYFENQIKKLFEKIKNADNIISYNGEGFDFDVLKSHGYNYKFPNSIDLCKKLEIWTGIRRKMDYVGKKYFGIKKHTKGKEMSKIAGQELAIACKEDVKLTKLIYEKCHKFPPLDFTKIRHYNKEKNEAKYTRDEINVYEALRMGKDRDYYAEEWFSWAINHLQKVIDKEKINWLKENDIKWVEQIYDLSAEVIFWKYEGGEIYSIPDDEKSLQELSINELKEICSILELKKSGQKSKLIQRIIKLDNLDNFCQGMTKNNQKCRQPLTNGNFCSQHNPLIVQRCQGMTRENKRCGQRKSYGDFCFYHRQDVN